MPTSNYLFVLGSARADGNTESLARRAAAQLPSDVGQTWLDLRKLHLPTYVDTRHDPDSGGVYPRPEGDLALLMEATLAATDLVIVSPLYWYSVSTSVKLYLDHWTGFMRVPGVDFRPRMRGKTMWGVTTLSDDDRALADPLVGTLRNSADYLGMHWGGMLFGDANRPGDVERDEQALIAAETFFAKPPAGAMPQ